MRKITMSLSARRAWIEIASCRRVPGCALRSLSARRAWIEIQVFQRIAKPFRVALRKESVDRNKQITETMKQMTVALRKESVDRNLFL